MIKKSKAPPEKSPPKAQTKKPASAAALKTVAKKTGTGSSQKKSPGSQSASKQPATASQKLTMPERVGLTAGNIWHYLIENGDTKVSTLVRELPEEEKIIQRSLGWLARENKIILETSGPAETVVIRE